MNDRPATPSYPRPLAALALAVLASAAPGQGLTSETFGSVSGDVPFRGLGLVLELVGADTEHPRLRLFGGLPGHPAAILLASGRAEVPGAGPRGTRQLVSGDAQAIHGRFDARGYFEVSIDPSVAQASNGLCAQGVHTGVLQLVDGPRIQCSHGLEVRCAAAPVATGFDELLPHAPEARSLGEPESLAALLQDALDSGGDQLHLALELEVTVGLGIEVVDAKAGGKVGFEVTVTRATDGTYEVELAEDVAGLVGVGAGFGAEVGAEAGNGVGGTRIFAFHSAPGAARGILGMALALQFPAFRPGRHLAESPTMQAARERVVELREAVRSMRERSAELEAYLWNVAEARLDQAAASHARARQRLASARAALRAASWRQVPAAAARVALHRAIVAGSGATLRAARAARRHAEAAVDAVGTAIEAHRRELDELVEGLARAGRIAAAITQLRAFATDHYAGWELRTTQAVEVEAKVGVPVVDVKGLENSATGAVSSSYRIRREIARDGAPARTTVTAVRERTSEVVGAVVAGFELSRARTIEVAQVFEQTPHGPRSAGATLTFGADVCGLTSVGLGLQVERGIGRSWSVSMADTMFLSQDGLASLTSPAALIDRAGNLAVALQLQDRRQQNIDFAFSVDVTGNGGGIEIQAEWSDAGRMLSRETTVADAVNRVMDGALRIVDERTGIVTAVE